MEDDFFSHNGVAISVVLPCYNESESVGLCVDEAYAGIHAARLGGEVIVIDNNSTDNSIEVALSHRARVISEPQPGYGSALRAGIDFAQGSIVVMADADLTYELSGLLKLVEPILDETADLVIGKRILDSRRSMPFLHRYIGTPVLTKLVKLATEGIELSDSQSGFRAFRKDKISELGLSSTGMEFASEMLIKAARKQFRILEVDTFYRARVGESKLDTFSDGLRHLREIILLAPSRLVIIPSVLLFAVGLVVGLLSFVFPTGLRIGSLLWQPVFFSGIAMIVGLQMFLGGLFLSNRSEFASSRWQGLQEKGWFKYVLALGIAAIVAGTAIDGSLFLIWVTHSKRLSIQSPLASFAQVFLVDGVSLAGFGVLVPCFERPPSKALPFPEFISGPESGRDEDPPPHFDAGNDLSANK